MGFWWIIKLFHSIKIEKKFHIGWRYLLDLQDSSKIFVLKRSQGLRESSLEGGGGGRGDRWWLWRWGWRWRRRGWVRILKVRSSGSRAESVRGIRDKIRPLITSVSVQLSSHHDGAWYFPPTICYVLSCPDLLLYFPN